MSNIIMMVILLALVFVLAFYILRIFVTTYISNSIESIEKPVDDSISVYELQILFDGVIDMVTETDGKIEQYRYYNRILDYLNATRTLTYITMNNEPLYITEGYQADEILSVAAEYNASVLNHDDTVMYSDSSGFLYKTTITLQPEGGNASFLLVNRQIGTSEFKNDNRRYWAGAADDISDAVRSISVLGAMVIVIVNCVLVVVISNSILRPLNKLKAATQMIKEGNLDFELEYDGQDEITDVIRNFEDMRRTLSTYMERQRKYEEDRKELIAGISHDLSTPLTSIKGYVSGLMDGIADSPEKQEKYLKTIYNTTEEMNTLVEELFLFSKLDLDKIPFDFQRTNLSEYIASCCEEITFNLEKKHVILTYTDLCEHPVYAQLDRNQFARVLMNIADNSAKYKCNEIGKFCVTLQEEDGEAHIMLQDDGRGVPKELTDKIFDSFYRSDPARTNPVGGSGLGLSIAKQIVESHGGRIWAESNIGEGMTIHILLQTEDVITKPAALEASEGGGHIKEWRR